jgi:hypothetical protein
VTTTLFALIVAASLGRSAVLITVSYLALRRSQPRDRAEILRTLGPALEAARSPTLTNRADDRQACIAGR